MGTEYASAFKEAAKLGSLIMPLLVIGGLLLLWACIVIICLYLGPEYAAPLSGITLAH